MNIYFACSIWGANADLDLVKGLLAHLKTKGNVLSEHLFTQEYRDANPPSLSAIHDRDISWVNQADRIVAEVTQPSLGVGYELREGVIRSKPILCLYQPILGRRLSAMVAGCSKIQVANYNTFDEARKAIDNFFKD